MKSITMLCLLCSVTLSYGATRVVSNAGVVLGCPAQYSTIQSAISAANPGDTVYVCNTGVPFNEQVTINKGIKLSGQTGAMIRPQAMVANTNSLTSGAPIAAAITVTSTTGVTISNLIVDGSQNQITGCAPDLMGVYFQNASGTIAYSAIRYFELGSGLEGCQSGLGIFVQTDGASGTATVAAVGNSVHDFQKNGITANEMGATLNASANVVTGWGPTPNIAQNGIQIGFGAGGTIAGNTVTNVAYTPCTSTTNCNGSSTGILIYAGASGITVRQNNVSNTQGAIYYFSAPNGTISGNTLSNTAVYDGIGIDWDGTNPGGGNTVSSNTIMNSSESGVYSNTTSNTITTNKIIETPIGIWLVSNGSSQSGNTFYATPVTVQNGMPPARVGRPGPKAQAFR